MIVGIDGSNLRRGGGVTHLVSLLGAADPASHGIRRIIVWGASELLDRLPERPWLARHHQPALEESMARRFLWQRFELRGLASRECNVLFAPGGVAPAGFRPLVTQSQNLLPFEPRELRRYGASPMGVRLRLLRLAQARTFRGADGVIFLTDYARAAVIRAISGISASAVIPHGVDERFRCAPRPQREPAHISHSGPLRVLYVSIVDLYKHQEVVARAVAAVRREGLPIAAEFVGPAYGPALRKFRATVDRLDPDGDFLHYRGPVAHADLPRVYREAEVFVFASSCETFGIILLEAMAAGLPIACSNRGAMPEVLGGAGELFDPESAASIANTLRHLAENRELRQRHAEAAHARARQFTWEHCAHETLGFVARVGKGNPVS